MRQRDISRRALGRRGAFAPGRLPCLLAGASTAYLAAVAPSLARAADATETTSSRLEEIVVVAQKREINLQKAPVAVTALSSVALDKANVRDATGLNGLVPGLVVSTSEGFNRSVAIRGVGFNVPQNDAAQPSVSYHIDGVYIANPVALDTGFLDVSHIEVVRGPQGTVFGQNSTGGTINVISNLPSTDGYHGAADLSLGNFDLIRARAAVNLPLSDEFAIRVSIDRDYHDGFAKATQVPGTNGSYDLGDDNSIHGRLQLLWQPTSNFSAVLRAEYAHASNHESEGKNITDPDPDPWRETSDWPGKFIYSNEIYSATLKYNLPWATLKSLSSYQYVSQNGSVNEDGLDTALMTPDHDVEWLFHKSFAYTQEVDISSNPGGQLDWIVGAFYLNVKEKVGYDQYLLSTTNDFDANLLNFPPPAFLIPEIEDFTSNLYFQSASTLKRQSYSFYGQATYRLTSALRITGGLRETHDANSTYISDYFNLVGPPVFVKSSVNALTGKAALEYDLAPKNLLYASFSTGFKPGGGNISLAPAVVPFEFKPEHITAYEIGSKNAFYDDRIRLNAAAFFYRYKDMQYEAEDLIPFEGGVDNIPAVSIWGVEGEGSVLLPYDFRLDGSLTLENGEITSHFNALDNVRADAADQAAEAQEGSAFYPGDPLDIALRSQAYRDVYGNPPPNLPRVTSATTLSQALHLSNGATFTSQVNVQYRDHYVNTVFGPSNIYTAPSYVLWNLNFDYTPANSSWSASFTITNLMNYDAVLSRFTNQFGGETTQQYAPPRQFIVRLAYKF